MVSRALTIWRTESSNKLDELIAAHASVGGAGRGRRYATEQINASLVVLLAAHFQLFCHVACPDGGELVDRHDRLHWIAPVLRRHRHQVGNDRRAEHPCGFGTEARSRRPKCCAPASVNLRSTP